MRVSASSLGSVSLLLIAVAPGCSPAPSPSPSPTLPSSPSAAPTEGKASVPRPEQGRFRVVEEADVISARQASARCNESGANLAEPRTLEQLDALRAAMPNLHGPLWLGGGRCADGQPEAYCWADGSPVELPYETGVWVRNGKAGSAEQQPLFLTHDDLLAANPAFAREGVRGFVCAWDPEGG